MYLGQEALEEHSLNKYVSMVLHTSLFHLNLIVIRWLLFPSSGYIQMEENMIPWPPFLPGTNLLSLPGKCIQVVSNLDSGMMSW